MIQEGRACLETNLACFCFFFLYGVGLSMGKICLNEIIGDDIVMANSQYMLWDILGCVCFPYFMTQCKPCALHRFSPSSAIFSRRIGAALFGTMAIISLAYFVLVLLLESQPFFVPWSAEVLGIPKSTFSMKADNFEASTTFFLLGFHVITTGFVLSFGGHHRQPIWQNSQLCAFYTAFVALWALLLFGQNTAFHGFFRVNCDSTATMNWTGILAENWGMTKCILAPQMAHWGQGAQNKLEAIHILVQSALKDEGDRCMPSMQKMHQLGVAPDYRVTTAFNLIYSLQFRFILASVLLVYFMISCLFHGWVSMIEPSKETKQHDNRSNSKGLR
jgi:hypothetical protein